MQAEKRKSNHSQQPERSLDTKGKLVYWGFSYGVSSFSILVSHFLIMPRLLLGATFASMFPESGRPNDS